MKWVDKSIVDMALYYADMEIKSIFSTSRKENYFSQIEVTK